MAKNYNNYNYFENRPDIVKIFEDLEAFKDWCRLELCEFNEAHLYNRQSQIWNNYYHATRPRKPRGEYNRSGNYKKFQRQ